MAIERLVASELSSGEPLWFLEVDATAVGNLRLFVVVDCSDSCFDKLAPNFERLLVPLLDKLATNDRVDVWLLGESSERHSACVGIGARGRTLYPGVRAALAPTQDGTWLDPTLPLIFSTRMGRGETPVLVLFTDGEAFDAGRDLGGRFARSLVVGPTGGGFDLARLVPGADVQNIERTNYGDLLSRPSVRRSLELDWRGRLAYAFDAVDRPDPKRLRDAREVVEDGGVFRVALVGGDVPKVWIRYGTDTEDWREGLDVHPVTLSASAEPSLDYLRMRIQGLEFDIRRDVRAALNESVTTLTCQYCRADFDVSELLAAAERAREAPSLRGGHGARLRCAECKCIRLFDGIAFEHDDGARDAMERWLANPRVQYPMRTS